jgi:hypothetical protein
MPVKNRRPRAVEPNLSHRWDTTLTKDLESVAEQLKGSEYYDTNKRLETLRTRKLANTKTSISFGNHIINYVSDSHDNQISAGAVNTPAERLQQKAELKKMKAALTQTTFSLGDEVPVYASIAREAMATSETDEFKNAGKVQMNDELKAAIKKSSLHFGNEKVLYETVQQDATKAREQTVDRDALKKEIAEMTAALRKHNFSFGEEQVEYISDQTRGYGSVPKEAYGQRQRALPKIRETIQDSRSCHFSLGLDKVVYDTDTHRALRTVTGAPPKNLEAERQRLKEMKQALQRTSITIGDDEEYM